MRTIHVVMYLGFVRLIIMISPDSENWLGLHCCNEVKARPKRSQDTLMLCCRKQEREASASDHQSIILWDAP